MTLDWNILFVIMSQTLSKIVIITIANTSKFIINIKLLIELFVYVLICSIFFLIIYLIFVDILIVIFRFVCLNKEMSFRFLIEFDFDWNVEIKKIMIKLWNDNNDKNLKKKM